MLSSKCPKHILSRQVTKYSRWFSSETLPEYNKEDIRRNELGIQMISESMRSKIFGPSGSSETPTEVMDIVRKHLSSHDLWKPNQALTSLNPSQVEVPPMKGFIEDHFLNLGTEYSLRYKKLCDAYCKSLIKTLSPPKEWSPNPGWTRYNPDGTFSQVDFPADDFLVIDVEVCVTENNLPVLAAARSQNTWYSWCHPVMSDESISLNEQPVHCLNDLISIGKSEKPRILVGHNIGFDRSFFKEAYFIESDETRFMDTMSLHVIVSGLTGYQRALSASHRVARRKGINESILHDLYRLKGQPNPSLWVELGTLNSLKDVFEFYCRNDENFTPLSKEERNVFVEGSLDDIRDDFQNLLSYCARDVEVTSDVFRKIWPLFLTRCPHPVTLAGMLEMSIMYLPTRCNDWLMYIHKSDAKYEEFDEEIISSLGKLACQACSLLHDDKYKKDVWMWDLDWSVQHVRYRQSIEKAFIKERLEKVESQTEEKKDIKYSTVDIILHSSAYLKRNQPRYPGYPSWFRDLTSRNTDSPDWRPGPYKISTLVRAVPKLMRLTWDGYALHHDKKHGWGFLIPYKVDSIPPDGFPYEEYIKIVEPIGVNQDPWDLTKDVILMDEETSIDLIPSPSNDEDWLTSRPEYCPEVEVFGCRFFKLPHKDGVEANVGNPLSKEFLRYIEDGRLSAFDNDIAHSLLELNKNISYWKMSKKRIKGQMVVKLDADNGVILPRVVVAGTVTRRAVEPTWLTASNAKVDRVGSELKGMIRAPKGWKFVGADVDSQELWIASVLGDAAFAGVHGCTGIGWMTLEGDKASGTDLHSKTASIINISRNEAKILNYGRIYGAGKVFAARFLKQSNPSLTEEEALRKARDIYKKTKGLKKDGKWVGGTESFMFNRLEKIARSQYPKTPVLGCRVSRALESRHVKDSFMTSIVNWVVQSSAVDFLHLMLVSMKWLFKYYKIEGRFAISIHDEVRFLVREEDAYKTALALQITNLLTRSFVCSRLGMKDLPQSIAFFSAVDVDDVLRKEPDMESVTPSNPKGLREEYGVEKGESLDIDKVLEKIISKR